MLCSKQSFRGNIQWLSSPCKININSSLLPRIFIHGMMGGQYTKFEKAEPTGPIWNDPRIFGCFSHAGSGQVGVICTYSPGGTIYFTADVFDKTLVIRRGLTGRDFMSIPYRPRLKVWDVMSQVMGRWGREDESNRSKDLVLNAGSYKLVESDWHSDLKQFFPDTAVPKEKSEHATKTPKPEAKKAVKKPAKQGSKEVHKKPSAATTKVLKKPSKK